MTSSRCHLTLPISLRTTATRSIVYMVARIGGAPLTWHVGRSAKDREENSR